MAAQSPFEIGKTDTHVTLRAGPWTIHLPIDKDGRYPRVRNSLPDKKDIATTLHIAPDDAAFLVKTLPKLAVEDASEPLTLDIGQEITVRARGEDQKRATECVLARSRFTGKPICLCVNRALLLRCLQLGFGDIQTRMLPWVAPRCHFPVKTRESF